MKVFVAGATGAMGQALVPQLVARGHDVVGLTRSPAKAQGLRTLGAEPVVADALDAEAIREVIVVTSPDAVVHQLTALPPAMKSFRRLDESFAATNRLRTEGLDILVAAAREAEAGTLVVQSYAGWPYAREGGPVKTEADPLDDTPPKPFTQTLDAIRYLERVTLDAGGIVLRYGGFYGPGTGLAPGAPQVDLVRQRKFPIVGDGAGVWSFVHVDDAAAATVAAVEHGGTGVYNVVDDDPAPVSQWLPALAEAIGAKPPRHVPVWLARVLAGDGAVVMLHEVRGASNLKAKQELGWSPAHPSWREGFVSVLGATEARPARRQPVPGGAACQG